MSRPVSIVVWRDAKTDPPTGDEAFAEHVLVLFSDGDVMTEDAGTVAEHPESFAAWTTLPVVSDLTDDDVRDVALWALDGERIATGSTVTADRLRAALDGEKEET